MNWNGDFVNIHNHLLSHTGISPRNCAAHFDQGAVICGLWSFVQGIKFLPLTALSVQAIRINTVNFGVLGGSGIASLWGSDLSANCRLYSQHSTEGKCIISQ